jgi:hypothetical protein
MCVFVYVYLQSAIIFLLRIIYLNKIILQSYSKSYYNLQNKHCLYLTSITRKHNNLIYIYISHSITLFDALF